MKILYDISVLGKSLVDNRARTGVFRVVENVALGLTQSVDVQLLFSAMETLTPSLDYVREHELFSGIPFAYPKLALVIEKHKDAICHRARAMSPVTQIPLKILAETLRVALRIVKNDSPFGHLATNVVDVFHSPFLPIPPDIVKIKNVKRFITVYDLIPLLHPEYFEFKEDHLLRRVVDCIDPETHVIAISQSTKDDLCSYRKQIDPSRIVVTHLAASPFFYKIYDNKKIAEKLAKYSIPNRPYILSLSTLEPRKNIDHIIRCFAKIINQEKIDDLCLVLVGSKGWDYSKIFEELSKYESMSDRIIVTGYVSDEDLAALYSGALAFVYPSLYEGFGLPPLEAMQCGVPVITSNTSSLPEVVGDAGILVDPRDGDSLCEAILSLYNDTSRRAVLSELSLQRSSQFSWTKCVDETIAAYRSAIER
ncbi:glycosyltransferase family 4 protein [Geobacter pickeringii]|uniref:glycosyltransferase family 4 protein n=1 Tax=Geobacter pickeringii TaxID=345632 RepID=UPI000A0510DA|nr:glycosyltransferase family 1 protein [Geobacter pickeringii]